MAIEKMTSRIARYIVVLLLLAGLLLGGTYVYLDSILVYYKPSLEKLASEALGLDVTCDDVDLTLFPVPRLKLENVSLGSPNSKWFSADVPKLLLEFELSRDMLSRPQLHKLVLDGPQFKINLAASNEKPPVEAPTESGLNTKGSTQATEDVVKEEISFAMRLDSLQVQKGSLIILDTTGDILLRLRPIDLSAQLQLENYSDIASADYTTYSIPEIVISSDLMIEVEKLKRQLTLSDFKLRASATRTKDGFLSQNVIANAIIRSAISGADLPSSNSVPLSVSFEKILYADELDAGTLTGGVIKLGKNELSLSGSLDVAKIVAQLDGAINVASLEAVATLFPSLRSYFKGVGIESKVQSKFAVDITSTPAFLMTVRGDLAGESLRLDQSKIDRLDLEKFSMTFDRRRIAGNSKLNSKAISIVSAAGEKFGASDLTGALSFEYLDSGEITAGGDLAVSDFSYSDQSVDISKVNARLNGIKASVSKNGSVSVTLGVEGKSIYLTTEDFMTDSVRSVSGTVTVSVPAGGGYSVSGPVSVTEGGMTAAERRFEPVNGTVDMFVSSPSKKFMARGMSAVYRGEAMNLDAQFEMTDAAYDISGVKLKGFEGALSGGFKLYRKADGKFESKLTAENIKFEKLQPLVRPNKENNFVGRMTLFDADVTGSLRNIPASLKGRAKFLLEDGTIKRVRADKVFVTQLQRITSVGKKKIDAVTIEDGDGTNTDNYLLRETYARQMQGDMNISGANLLSSNFEIVSSSSVTRLKGLYNLDSGLDMRGSVVFLEETFRALGGPIGPLRDLFGTLGKIEIPIIVTGPTDNVSVRADPSGILRTTAPTRAVEGAIENVSDALDFINPFKGRKKKSDTELTPLPEMTPNPVTSPVSTRRRLSMNSDAH